MNFIKIVYLIFFNNLHFSNKRIWVRIDLSSHALFLIRNTLHMINADVVARLLYNPNIVLTVSSDISEIHGVIITLS